MQATGDEAPSNDLGVDRGLVDALREIPKVELHVHLEGSLAPSLSLELARKNGIDIGATTADEVLELYRFTDFGHFLVLYGQLTHLFAEPDDFRVAVVSYGRAAAQQGAVYVELTITLETHVGTKQLDPESVMAAAWLGAVEVEAETGLVIRFILDHVRSFPLETCFENVDWCARFRHLGVVGLGLAGPELGWPASTYGPALDRARELGVPFVPHAGEADGADAIRDALHFAPRRIGHGVAASGEVELQRALRDADVMVEVCVSSNVTLGHAESHAGHPARELHREGIAISINTDDPPMFGTDLLREHLICNQILEFDVDDLLAVNRRALDYALADDATLLAVRGRF